MVLIRVPWRKIQHRAFIGETVAVATGNQTRRTRSRSQNQFQRFGEPFIQKLMANVRSFINMKDLKDQPPLVGKSKKNFTVAVEGNIGCGKSTLLKHFEDLSCCEVLGEPLEKWTNVNGHNALGLLYQDPKRWSFSFNMYAQLTRVQMHMKPHTQSVKMMERSLYSTRYCFVQNDHLSETITGFEFSVLSQWFEHLVKTGKAEVDLLVYLRADPVKCYERVQKRSRKEEAGVPLAFLESLHNLHEDWLIHKKYPVPSPVLVLDANYDLETMKETYDTRRQEILCGCKI